ncbi:hypothetical protein F4821DRAFT_248306 [Hypoxylon rubiginosum]|uniref:Uncharacterized protein n=1 Tax=Hypoxylon rubiginosum TaxID=110542 RepID=A0ACC0CN56_9PEZI|nr:hypothetical protein F4821DRAFT_248306 [Hypoxylon rubiginosum]
MTITLQCVYQSNSSAYNITIRDHSRNAISFCPPYGPPCVQCIYTLGWAMHYTELNVTDASGRTATIQLEEVQLGDNKSDLRVSGTILGGHRAISINKDHFFNIKLTDNGHMLLIDQSGSWGANLGDELEFTLLPFCS